MPQAVDYDALAKQAGAVSSAPATVDYAALAKQAGAVSSTPAPDAQGGAMNFAIVNGKKIDLSDVPDDIKAQLQDHTQHGDELLENIRNIGTFGKDLVVGGIKSLARSGIRGGALLRAIPGVDAVANALPSVSVPVEPTNTAQQLGGYAEQAAEVAAPARAVASLGAKTAEVAAPYLARVLSPTLAKLVPQIAVEAAGNAGLAKAQGATNTEAGVTAGLSAVAPTIGTVATALADKLRGDAAGHVEQFFSPTTKPFKQIIANRTADILDRGADVLGTAGRTRQGAADVFDAEKQKAGEAIDEALKTFGNDTVPDAPQRLMAALDTAKAPYVKTRIVSADEAAGPLKQFVVGPMSDGRVQVAIPLNGGKVKQIDALKQIVQSHGDQMSVDDLVGLRRAWDEIAYAKPGYGEIGPSQSAKWAKKMGGDAIRGIVQSDRPDLAALNREFSFWKDLSTVMDATNLRKVGQTGLLPQMAEGAAVAGTLAKGTIGQAILVGKAAKLAQRIFTSPRYNSLAANIKNGLSEAMVSGNQSAIAHWLGIAGTRVGEIEAPREIGELGQVNQ